MKLKKIGHRNFTINLFADFLLKKIGLNSSTQISIVDLNNFIVVKGKTDSKEIINLSESLTEFEKEFDKSLNQNKIKNIIDLIDYDVEIKEVDDISFNFFNTEKCSYHHKQLEMYFANESSWDFENIPKKIDEKSLYFTSEFPHGYSMNQGRLLYYFSKKIFYSIPPNYPVTSLTFEINKNHEDFIKVYDNFSNSYDYTLQSAILDCVNMNLEKLEKELKDLDLFQELMDPTNEHEVLKKNKPEIIII